MYRHPILFIEPDDLRWTRIASTLHPFVAARLQRVSSVREAIDHEGLRPASVYLISDGLDLSEVLALLVEWRAVQRPGSLHRLGNQASPHAALLAQLGLSERVAPGPGLSDALFRHLRAPGSGGPVATRGGGSAGAALAAGG